MRIVSSIAMGLVLLGWAVPSPAQSIVDDAEYYALKTQHADKWAAEDQQLEQKLAELRAKNGGKPPNIIHIMWHDQSFGDVGIPEIATIRGYETPNINWEADSGDKLTFPIGLGVTKTVRFGKMPVKLRAEVHYSIIRPEPFGEAWNFRFQITPVIKSPFQ